MAAKRFLEPATPAERLRGWLLHAHKCRDRHDEAALSYDSLRYWLGVPTIICSTIAGASALASFSKSPGSTGGIIAGIVSLVAAVLAALQTFFDYPGRAERHRLAATKFKAIIRELEQALTGTPPKADQSEEWVTDFRRRMDALEEISPVVSRSIYDRVEQRYVSVTVVTHVLELAGANANGAEPGAAVDRPREGGENKSSFRP
jgi:hypothetical protein